MTASIRMLTARAMLRRGRDTAVVARATQVPHALVELIADAAGDCPPPPAVSPKVMKTAGHGAVPAESSFSGV